jgi:hypothetical protein
VKELARLQNFEGDNAEIHFFKAIKQLFTGRTPLIFSAATGQWNRRLMSGCMIWIPSF